MLSNTGRMCAPPSSYRTHQSCPTATSWLTWHALSRCRSSLRAHPSWSPINSHARPLFQGCYFRGIGETVPSELWSLPCLNTKACRSSTLHQYRGPLAACIENFHTWSVYCVQGSHWSGYNLHTTWKIGPLSRLPNVLRCSSKLSLGPSATFQIACHWYWHYWHYGSRQGIGVWVQTVWVQNLILMFCFLNYEAWVSFWFWCSDRSVWFLWSDPLALQ